MYKYSKNFDKNKYNDYSDTILKFLSSYAFNTVNIVIIPKVNKFLLALVILFKRINFQQYISSAGAKEY